MIARLTSPCACGAIVKPGMQIGYDPHFRRVFMCPACSPSSTRPKAKAGKGTVIGKVRLQSLRIEGRVVGFRVSWANPCEEAGAAHWAWRDGAWKEVRHVGWGPSYTPETFAALLEQAVTAAKAAA